MSNRSVGVLPAIEFYRHGVGPAGLRRKNNMKKSILRASAAWQVVALCGAGIAAGAIVATPAMAQNVPGAGCTTTGATSQNDNCNSTATGTPNVPGQPNVTVIKTDVNEGQSIIVTGSRIRRPELSSTVPVAVIGSNEILQNGSANISDVINELPQAAIGSTRTNTNFQTSGTGIATVNLRSLGSSRTLTLVNGRRFISGFAGDSAVDLNNIPTDFVERVEIVTGGSSAVYGSEAIAGVVNFILKDHYDGIGVRAQTGITARGDNPNYLASVTAGHSFFDNRVHAMANFSWDKDEGLGSRNRAFSRTDCAGTPIDAAGNFCGPAAFSSFASQGRFDLGKRILPGGNRLFTFDKGTGGLVYGFPTGSGFDRNAVRLISTPVERKLLTGVINADVTDHVKAFFEGTYAWTNSDSSIEPLALGTETTGLTIPITNPFIPADVAAAIAAANSDANPSNNVSSIQFRRRSNDIFDRSNSARRKTWRIAAGLKGDLGKYNWEVSYVHGDMRDSNKTQDILLDNYGAALDSIRVGPGNVLGTDIVCRDPVARAAGCIPLNIFGANTVDPRAAAYVVQPVPRSELIHNQEDVATASLSGPLFTAWAGDITAAVGAEYRKEKTTDINDTFTLQGLNSGNQLTNLTGQYHVWEGFGELNVPLLKDMSFTKYLGVNGAARYSKYSTVGGVWSYNVGAEWQPIRDIRFRGEYAVANRAPNIGELFSQPSQTFAAINDPCQDTTASTGGAFGAACRAIPGVAAQIAANGVFHYTLADLQIIDGFIGGNAALREETAKTKTLGVVFTPRFIPGLGLTVDYYDIKITKAIATLGRNFSVAQCLTAPSPVFCDNVIRDPATGFVTRVNGQLINVAGFQNSGIDVGLNYGRRLNLMADDRFTLGVNYTYLIHNKTQGDPSTPATDSAGTFGRGYSRHSALVRASYKAGVVTFGWTTNFLSGGEFVKDFDSNSPGTVALNKIRDYWTHAAQLRFDVKKDFTFYLNMDNVFDRKPQLLPGAAFGTPTGLETSPDFDVFGRRFAAGVKVHF